MSSTTNLKLEYLTQKFLKDPTEVNNEALMDEITHLIVQDAKVIIDGRKLDDGRIDPVHIQVELDHRYYFHVYTSKIAFADCNGDNPYVIPLKALLDPIFQDDTFGGITLNYKKGSEVVLVSKENIYESLQGFLRQQNPS